MLQLIGTCAGIDTEDVNPPSGDPFVSTTIRVVSGEGRTDYVRASRDFPDTMLPKAGEQVVLAVWPRPYVQKASGDLKCAFTTFARVS